MPDASQMLCGDWAWDPVLKEMRHNQRRGKGWAEEPDAVERLRPVKSVTWYRWSQTPMMTHTGQATSASQSRIVAAYEGGGDLTIDEPNRECAEKIASAIASAYGLTIIEEGAPTGRRAGNLPSRDEMGRLVNREKRQEVILDGASGEITVSRSKRPFGKSRQSFRTSEVRRLEFEQTVRGPLERLAVIAVVGPEEERLPLASYEGYEGWADVQEWRDFTQELARSFGVESRVEPQVSG